MLSLPGTLEYNSTNKLFDLACKSSKVNEFNLRKYYIQMLIFLTHIFPIAPLKRVRLRDIVPGYPHSFSLLQLQELGM